MSDRSSGWVALVGWGLCALGLNLLALLTLTWSLSGRLHPLWGAVGSGSLLAAQLAALPVARAVWRI